jgi:transposase
MIPAHVAKELHRSRTWTSDWLARYHKEGIDGLENRPKSVGLPNYLEKLLLR